MWLLLALLALGLVTELISGTAKSGNGLLHRVCILLGNLLEHLGKDLDCLALFSLVLFSGITLDAVGEKRLADVGIRESGELHCFDDLGDRDSALEDCWHTLAYFGLLLFDRQLGIVDQSELIDQRPNLGTDCVNLRRWGDDFIVDDDVPA